MRSLGTLLAVVISTVLFGLMVVVDTLVEKQLTQAIYQQEIEQAGIHARTLRASLQTLMLNGSGTLAREWLDRMHGTAGITEIEVLRRDGSEAFRDLETVTAVNRFLGQQRFYREPSPRNGIQTSADAFEKALRGETAVDMRAAGQITLLLPISQDAECTACHGYDNSSLRGVLRLSLSTEFAEKRIQSMRTNLWMLSVLLVLVLGTGLWLALRFSVLRPIARLRDAISKVAQGDRHASLPVGRRDELGEVASIFNQMQAALRASETRVRAVMDNVVDGIVTMDERGIIESVNPAAERLFGYAEAEMAGKNFSMLVSESWRGEDEQSLAGYIKPVQPAALGVGREVTGLRKDNLTFPMDLALSRMPLGDATYFVAIVRDITNRKEQTAALRYQALHDALTDLPNRTLLNDRLRQAILTAQRQERLLALLIMDLDRFKEINDTLGHHIGDLVLQEVAKRMRAVLRESDTVARLGGDEFAVLLPEADAENAIVAAAKILKGLEAPFILEGRTLDIGASIGIALFPEHGEDGVSLMQHADVAMYTAKRGGRGYALYEVLQDQHSLRHLALAGELRHAIEHDQLLLHYQPKIDLASGRVYSVEALVRWQHPLYGLMQPDEFIPLAEETGLIRALTVWVFGAAFSQCAEWQRSNVDITIAINLSVRNLQDPGLIEEIKRIIEACGTGQPRLNMEVTETSIMAEPQRSLAMLKSLARMGVRLAIDDFGTGYSSLAYLKQLPVNEIKIDKSFVIGMAHDEDSVVIVRSTIDLAHNLGLQVVAEGVEDRNAYDLLARMGCDAAQGFYMSRPLPLDQLAAWLEESPWGLAPAAPPEP
jgi:diguanylate cyclase (GGDEF)-like protein/PAS domain S-box-containing protein